MALIEKLKAIADAIRGKTGKTEEMTLDQMATEIAGIQSGGGGGGKADLIYTAVVTEPVQMVSIDVQDAWKEKYNAFIVKPVGVRTSTIEWIRVGINGAGSCYLGQNGSGGKQTYDTEATELFMLIDGEKLYVSHGQGYYTHRLADLKTISLTVYYNTSTIDTGKFETYGVIW